MDYLQDDIYHSSPPAPPPPPTNQTPPPPTPISYSPDPYNGMPPPPSGSYPDLATLMRACQDHGRRHGYACVTSSNNYKRGIAYVRCDRGGEYVNHWNVTDETRIRKNRTRRLVGCKWKARAKRNKEGDWVLTMMHDKHTGHDPSTNLAAHPSLRQLPDEAVEEARRAFSDGRSPKEVLELLQRGWNEAVTAQDVYNLKAKISRTDAGGGRGMPGRVGQRVRASLNVDPALSTEGGGMEGIAAVEGAMAMAMEGAGVLMEGMQDGGQAVGMTENAESAPEGKRAKKCECTCCEH